MLCDGANSGVYEYDLTIENGDMIIGIDTDGLRKCSFISSERMKGNKEVQTVHCIHL